jgi:hypothetical protein
MGAHIPKIQYKNATLTGDTTNANATVSDVADTSDIEVGMIVTGSGIPAGTTVLSVGASSFTMNKNATATANNVSLSFAHELEFDYPPVEPSGEKLKAEATVSESLSGLKQVSINNVEATRKLKFSFLSHAKYLLLKDFLDDHAILGNDFRYFDDKASSSYITYELDKLEYEPKKITGKR